MRVVAIVTVRMTQRRKGITAFASTGLPTLPSQCGKQYTKLLFHLQNTQNTLWGQLTSQVLSVEHLSVLILQSVYPRTSCKEGNQIR